MEVVPPRFRGIYQLVGEEHFRRIADASVCVVGLGGVGSWSVEALARSGVGALTIVDLDEVCETNINRQIHAVSSTIGQSMDELLGDRILAIHPTCRVTVVKKFFSRTTADSILATPFDVVLDTIDRNESKTELIAACVRRSLPIVTVGSGGDRIDTSMATITDLARTIHDPLLQIVRKQLRQDHGFPKGERAKFHIPCVYAPLQRGPAEPLHPADSPSCTSEARGRKSCNDGLGSAVYVTGTLGFMAAGEVIRLLGRGSLETLYPWYKRSVSACSDL